MENTRPNKVLVRTQTTHGLRVMPHKESGLLADVVRTYRAATEGTGTNWRAGHAINFLAFGTGFGLAGLWLLASGAPLLDIVLFLCPAVVCLVGWRLLLKKALWYWHVETILYRNTRPSRITNWLSVLVLVLLVGTIIGLLLRAGGHFAA